MGGNKNNKQTTSTGICQMDSKNINNNGNNDSNKQPQLGCVKWVAKTSTTTKTKQPQLGCVKWAAKNINNNYNKNNLNWDMSNGWQKHRQQQQQQWS
jgi:hypothetical protein